MDASVGNIDSKDIKKESKVAPKKKRLVVREDIVEQPLKNEIKDEIRVASRKRWNEEFVDILARLSKLLAAQGEVFKSRAYKKAEETVRAYDGDITQVAQLKGQPGIGTTILEKLQEYVNTGTLQLLEREKGKPEYIFAEIHGIGPKKAKELVGKGVTTIAELRERQDELLNDVQKKGLKYYEDIQLKIPREEIDQYKKVFDDAVTPLRTTKNNVKMEIVGSYRRGAKESGDIDVIITSSDPDVFPQFTKALENTGIILETLSCGKTKCLVITRLPDRERARRVDFMYTTPEEYPFATLYFTGSKTFNTVMRGNALKLGFSLNEHSLYAKKPGHIKEEKVDHIFRDEKDIFEFLKMPYREPKERKQGTNGSLRALSAPKVEPSEPPSVVQGCELRSLTRRGSILANPPSPQGTKGSLRALAMGEAQKPKVEPSEPPSVVQGCELRSLTRRGSIPAPPPSPHGSPLKEKSMEPTKKKRGRPKKVKADGEPVEPKKSPKNATIKKQGTKGSPATPPSLKKSMEPTKKRRGRPPKVKTTEIPPESTEKVDIPGSPLHEKTLEIESKQGTHGSLRAPLMGEAQKPKVEPLRGSILANPPSPLKSLEPTKKKRGRPKKVKVEGEPVEPKKSPKNATIKKRGRPPKVKTTEIPPKSTEKVDVPGSPLKEKTLELETKKEVGEPAGAEGPQKTLKTRKIREPKVPKAPKEPKTGTAKRRGRPPKAAKTENIETTLIPPVFPQKIGEPGSQKNEKTPEINIVPVIPEQSVSKENTKEVKEEEREPAPISIKKTLKKTLKIRKEKPGSPPKGALAEPEEGLQGNLRFPAAEPEEGLQGNLRFPAKNNMENEIKSSPHTKQGTASKTLKKMSSKTVAKTHLKTFKKDGIKVLESLPEKDIETMIIVANDAYYNSKNPLLTDNEYDIIRDYAETKYPDNQTIKQVGAPITKNKVTLPYNMPSMDKIKPDTNALTSWTQKYPGPYVLSCKLDGVSGMYTTEGPEPKLYTRGDGKVGQDVSHLLRVLNLPPKKDTEKGFVSGHTSGHDSGHTGGFAIRGEFIIPKRVFDEKYKAQFANPRNLVSGIVNSKTLDDKTRDLHFVAYEVINPPLKISEQMTLLAELGHELVRYERVDTLSNNLLSETLLDWRANYEYEVDGVIVADDHIHPRKDGNPEHAFAFKMVISDQVAEAKVVDVLWTASKSGYLKPRVQIEPIKLGGVTIQYATGFNGDFIEKNKIGIGAVIQLVRSGDVIPHIKSVTTPAEAPKMPDQPYTWTKNHVDIVLENVEEDVTVRRKNITEFFTKLEVDGLSGKTVEKIMDAGFDTIPRILHMTKADFAKVKGFQETMVNKIHDGIKAQVAKATLLDIMAASNLFGRGIGERKIRPILEAEPNILTDPGTPEEKYQRLIRIKGIGQENAQSFTQNIDRFLAFLEACELTDKLKAPAPAAPKENVLVRNDHPLSGKHVVMSGVRDAAVKARVESFGGVVDDTIGSKTFILVVKSKGEKETSKMKYAREHNIEIMEPAEFLQKYN